MVLEVILLDIESRMDNRVIRRSVHDHATAGSLS